MTPKAVATKSSSIGKKTLWFMTKIIPNRSTNTVTPVQKLAPTVATINVQDDKEVVIVTEDNEVTFTKDEIGNLFQCTSSEEELGNE